MIHAEKSTNKQTHNKLFSQWLNEKQPSYCIYLGKLTGFVLCYRYTFSRKYCSTALYGSGSVSTQVLHKDGAETLPYGGSAFFVLEHSGQEMV